MNRLEIIKRLRACAEDPMWENHVEVSKKLLIDAANALEASEVEQIEARQRIIGPSLSEITDRFRDANVPEVSGQVFARR